MSSTDVDVDKSSARGRRFNRSMHEGEHSPGDAGKMPDKTGLKREGLPDSIDARRLPGRGTCVQSLEVNEVGMLSGAKSV